MEGEFHAEERRSCMDALGSAPHPTKLSFFGEPHPCVLLLRVLLVVYAGRGVRRYPRMTPPPPLGEEKIRLALLRDPTITGKDLPNVCADLRRVYDLPGSPYNVRAARVPYTR